MRLSILPLCLLVLGVTTGLTTTAQVKVGIEAGPNISRLYNAYYAYTYNGEISPYNSESRMGFTAGVFADVPIQELFIFRPKLLFTLAGGEQPALFDHSGNMLSPDKKFSFNYLNIPLQFLYSPELAWGRPWIGAGFYTSMMIGGKVKTPQGSSSLHLGGSSDDDFERWDFGFNPTAGLTFKNGFSIGADYQIGMVHISTPPVGGIGPRANTRNAIWSFHVAYEWKLKTKVAAQTE